MKRVLIVEKDGEMCQFVKRNLEQTGTYDVEICCRGQEAIEQARALKPDLILLGVLLPEVSGLEIAGELLNYEETMATPVLFLAFVAPQGMDSLIRAIEAVIV